MISTGCVSWAGEPNRDARGIDRTVRTKTGRFRLGVLRKVLGRVTEQAVPGDGHPRR